MDLIHYDISHVKNKHSMKKNYKIEVVSDHPEREAEILRNWFINYLFEKKIFSESDLI